MAELAELNNDQSGASNISINKRFDLLWSRVVIAQSGVVGKRMRFYDQDDKVLERLFALLQAEETNIVNISSDQKAEIDRLQSEFGALASDVSRFNQGVFAGERNRFLGIGHDLRNIATNIAFATGLAFCVGALLLWLINRESAANKRIAQHNIELAEISRRANQAKSRFLTMMSHELRTPMNGVLGMLSLARKSGMTTPQQRLIEQAERSGQQMIAMLGDIMDYSALQDGEIVFDTKPLEPRELVRSVEELFSSIARREGIALSVTANADCPKFVIGDFKRLRQVVAQFSSYIVEKAGTRSIEINFGHQDSNLVINFNFDHRVSNGSANEQLLNILMGSGDADKGQFSTDALGPSVARSILERMGGMISLDHVEDRISIVMRIPAEVMELNAIRVFIDARSEAVRMICTLALSSDDFEIVGMQDEGNVNTVLFEAGGLNEAERSDRLKTRFPKALMVSIGPPLHPQDFAHCIELPVDVNLLRQSVASVRSA